MKTTTIDIKKMGINGEGIGYLKQKPVFVEGALLFERVKIKDIQNFRTYYKATLDQIEIKSTHRVVPVCPLADTCGACSLMHADRFMQQKIKVDNLKQAFTKYARMRLNEVTYHPNPTPEGYRNQCKFVFGMHKGKVATGLYAKNSNQWIAIDHCLIHDPLLEEIRKQVVALCNKHRIPVASASKREGYRHLVIRVLNQTAQVTLVSSVEQDDRQLYKEIAQITHVEGVFLSINSMRKSVEIFGEKTSLVAKNPKLKTNLLGLNLQVSPQSFMQLNTRVASTMMEHVVSLIKPTDSVVEAYCGVGIMSLLVASKAKRVFGFDLNKNAINDAKKHAVLNQLNHVEFKAMDAKVGLKEASKRFKKFTLIVDPPRTGLSDKFIADVLNNKVAQIVYVSCNPSTLAKDLAILQTCYRVESVDAFDMFTHTPHLETVVLMSRIKR